MGFTLPKQNDEELPVGEDGHTRAPDHTRDRMGEFGGGETSTEIAYHAPRGASSMLVPYNAVAAAVMTSCRIAMQIKQPVDLRTRLNSTSRGAIIERYASISLSLRKTRNARMASATRPPASTVASYAFAAAVSHCHVSSNTRICEAARVPSCSANRTL